MLDRVRALLIVMEEGSVNRAAVRLRITQPALSRQMKLLESEIGGKLLERGSSGVTPTSLGHALVKSMRPVIDAYETAIAGVKRQARGFRSEIRIGFLISAAQTLLSPAMERLRATHPEIKLKLHDMSPREQIEALKSGDLDFALIGQEGAVAARDFHSLKLCSLGICAALSPNDPLASLQRIAIKDLTGRDFIGVDEDQMPGRNRWIAALCRTAGFKPRFLSTPDGITHVLSTVASESAVTLLPDYFQSTSHPGVVFVPISDTKAHWDFIVLWQKGKTTPSTTALVDALKETAIKLAGAGFSPP